MSKLEELVRTYIERHPDSAASFIEAEKKDTTLAYLNDLTDAELSSLATHLSPHLASLLIDQMDTLRAGAILNNVADAICAAVLRHISPDRRQEIVATLDQGLAKRIHLLLSFGPGTAASIMDNTVPAIAMSESIGNTVKLLKSTKHKSIYYLYLVDTDYCLRGVMNLKELLNASDFPTEPLSNHMNKGVDAIVADLSVESLLRHPAWLRYHSLPVVDHQSRYLGVIRYETIKSHEMQKREAEQRRDIHQTGEALGELYALGMAAFLGGASSAVVNRVEGSHES